MKKKTKVMMTMGIIGACGCIGAGSYMYMCKNKNKKKIQKELKKYMSYQDEI